jgi:omega-6 fatty acid desaturase (delta-12 desaturase)
MKRPDWFDKLQPFAVYDNNYAILYILTSVVPYLGIVAVMFFIYSRGLPYWAVLLLTIPAAGFYIRTFMILHDCSHSSFVNSKKLSNVLGHFIGLLTLTPFFDWQRNHGIHHASVSNLDKRGTGDIWTMTFNEYRDANTWGKLQYRFFRNPVFLFFIAPLLLFGIMYRFPQKSTRRKDYFSIAFNDVVYIIVISVAYYSIGLKILFGVFLPIFYLTLMIGMWLFYIQHQFENVYWAHAGNWDLINGAMNGSSYYKLPEPLRFFSGNIGYHNIHHLKPRIPCFNLKKCYDNTPDVQYTKPITLKSGFKSLHLNLWDEDTKRMISFKEAGIKIKSAIQ